MSVDVKEIIANLDSFDASNGDWDSLQRHLDDLFDSEEAHVGIDSLFGILERFPEEDGFGVFWSILHGIESISEYETKLLDSIKRKPTFFTIMMVNRIINDNQKYVGEVSLVELLKNISEDLNVTESLRKDAACYMEGHAE